MEKLTPDNATPEKVRRILADAGMEAKIDKDGDVYAKGEACGGYLFVKEGHPVIRVASMWGTRSSATRTEKLEFCNRVNDTVKMARACLEKNGSLSFDYFIPLESGIKPIVLVTAFKRFLDCVVLAVASKDDDNVVS